ncbi:uncharacterized protein LOC105914997 [Setaria italica]|uniref:uncharacterized protein LOC105914997 n=1 Tax=Setaria italica TaxID=4555 RepID=UPI0006481EBB|nr:uncharacterized protein LOC105914997 [Setaria italica]
MKRGGDIASLFQKHAAKKATAASNTIPSPVETFVEEQNQEHDRVVVEEIADPVPLPPPLQPPTSQPPVYDINRLPHDPGERQPIESYHVNDQDAIRRAYIIKGRFKPVNHDFPSRKIGGRDRQFNYVWMYNHEWLEYNIKKDSAFCFICYLFKKGAGSNTFIVGGWNNWNIRNKALLKHSGSMAHNAAQERYISFINPKVAIDYHIEKWTDEDLRLYKKRLTYSLRCIKFLLHQGLAFRGPDENEESSNRGNFIELLKFLAGNSDEVNKYVLNNAPADESSNISHKEQLALCLRYVDKLGRPCEHFIGVVHVDDTTSLSLKEAIEGLLRRDQDILNAISLVNVAKNKMQQLRSDGWDHFLERVTSFCIKHDVEVPAMDGDYVPYGKSARYARARNQTNDDHFRREVYIGVIDQIRQELDNRFDEINMELLSCMSAFSPSNSFASFDAQKVRRLAEFYTKDFSNNDLLKLELQLDNYIDDMRRDDSFKGLDSIVDLSVKLVQTRRHKVYDMVYLLLKLILLLPVATASVERVFSAMVKVKTKSRNKLSDSVLDDCLVTFIERDIFFQVNEEDIIKTFMSFKKRRVNKGDK